MIYGREGEYSSGIRNLCFLLVSGHLLLYLYDNFCVNNINNINYLYLSEKEMLRLLYIGVVVFFRYILGYFTMLFSLPLDVLIFVGIYDFKHVAYSFLVSLAYYVVLLKSASFNTMYSDGKGGFMRYLRFWFEPTLVYSEGGRKSRCIGRILYYFLGWTISSACIVFLKLFYFIPILEKIDGVWYFFKDLRKLIEAGQLMTALWILYFIMFFHYFCHMMAEITGYSGFEEKKTEPEKNLSMSLSIEESNISIFSREDIKIEEPNEFYLDWWNTYKLIDYWKKWNRPTHTWFKKIVYPRIKKKLTKNQAAFLIFSLSAVFHEYLSFLTVKKPCFIPFFTMLSQPFLIHLEKEMANYIFPEITNLFMWVFFSVAGGPLFLSIYVTLNKQ